LLDLPAFALARLGRLVRGAVRGAFEDEGKSWRAHFVLLCLHDYGELSQRELADHISMDRSDLVKLLDHLERAGLLRRAPDPDDRRRHLLSITPLGTETCQEGQHLVATATDRVLAGLDADQRALLHQLVLQAIDALG
jgi:DNA-binding MarR family transcriptional regulator